MAVRFNDCMSLFVIRIQKAEDVSKSKKDQDQNEHKVDDIFHCLANQNHEVGSTLEYSKPVEKSDPKCEHIKSAEKSYISNSKIILR